ncbi:MAG TPA: murein biosynthesis integral membrane protein MurJ [Parachlamydiaceae bacterium]|nr:murein biosynthesis integral membrane protein MurJ [Parachlamydiaceae bacterium]
MQNITNTNTLDSNRSILGSAARFFSGTMLSRITGLLRDICMAYAFGTQSAIAAMLVAFRFAHLLRRLLGEGAMQTALIPHFEELRKSDPRRAGRFFCDLSATVTHLLMLIIIVVMLGLGGILNWGGLDSGNQEIAWLTLVMMPSLLFICLFGINASLMQCEKSYFASSAAPIAFNLFWIIGIFFSSSFPPPEAMTILSLFVILACFAQWIATLPKVYSILKGFEINSLWKSTKRYSHDVLRLGHPLALGIIGVGASQINNALDAVFARWADAEGPAILWYAIRLQQLPLALFGIAIASALLPPLARAGKAGDHVQFRRFIDFATRRTVALMVPITFILFLLGDACINLVYGRGDFTLSSVVSTTQSLWGYTLGLIPMALVLILAPAFYSKGDYRTPSQAAVGAMVLNATLNTLLIAGFGLGAASVAIATSISAWVNLLWLGIVLEKETPWLSRELIVNACKILLASTVASLAVFALNINLWESFPALEILNQGIPNYPHSFIEQVLHMGINGLAFLVVLIIGAYCLRAKDLTQIAHLPKN